MHTAKYLHPNIYSVITIYMRLSQGEIVQSVQSHLGDNQKLWGDFVNLPKMYSFAIMIQSKTGFNFNGPV
jgi:hypothetical protein